MINPLFWLMLSFLLVSMSLTAVLVVLVPAVRELSRAARSVEKLCDTLSRELPPTLESIRLTSQEITELTDDMTEGVQNASRVAKQVDKSVSGAKQQAQRVQVSTLSLMAGMRAAWTTFTRPPSSDRPRPPQPASPSQRSPRPELDLAMNKTPSVNSGVSSERTLGEERRSTVPPQLPSSAAPEVDLAKTSTAADSPSQPIDEYRSAISENSRTDPLE